MDRICIDCGYNRAMNKRKICSACKSRRYRTANPVKSAYNTLKFHAKYRGKEFTLTLEEFSEFCVKTDYINKKGRTKEGYHVDRRDETKGYTKDNIQVLTNTENVRKFIEFPHLDEDNKAVFRTRTIVPTKPPEEDCPF